MNNRGSILVGVLLLIGVIGVLAAIAAEVQHAANDASRTFADGLRAEITMRAAIERTIGEKGITIKQLRDSVKLRIGEADVVLAVRDEASRIDLNHAPADLLAGIFRVVGVDAATAAGHATNVVSWRSDRATANASQASATGSNRGAALPRQPIDSGSPPPTSERGVTTRPGHPFQHVSELALVFGLPLATAAAVAPYVTVASGRPQINPLLADPPVLLALPDVNETQARDFLQQRGQLAKDFNSLIFRLGSVQKYVTQESGSAVRFEAGIRIGRRTERHFEVVVAVIEGDGEPYRILAWDSNPPQRIRALR